MADCSNVEIRELLPERAGGALSAADLARVDAHLASCGLCTSELALIHAARRSLRFAPTIDVGRIASGVVAATAVPSRPQLVASGGRGGSVRPAPRLRWVGWKAAAAVTIAAAGIGSFAVWQSTDDATRLPDGGTATVAAVGPQPAPATAPVTSSPATASPQASTPVLVASAAPSAQPAELGVAGGLGDLSSGDLQALLGDLGGPAIDSDASFEEPAVVVPEVGTVNGWESL